MRAVDTAARRDDPAKAASGLNPEGMAEISRASSSLRQKPYTGANRN
jgi:hypothetical protein